MADAPSNVGNVLGEGIDLGSIEIENMPYGNSIDFTSPTLAWDSFWENTILSDLQPSGTFFDGVDPMIDTEGLGESWVNMQEWADLSFEKHPVDHDALQDIQNETNAAGGVRFCCYGMISDASIKLVGNMSELAVKIDPLPPYQSFEVSKYSDYFMLKFPDGSPFAQVSEFVSRGLANIQQCPSVEIRAFAETKRIQRVFSRAKKPGEATMTVEINIYGSVTDLNVIGEELSSAKLFLQDPSRAIENIEYHNPHTVEFLGIEEPKPESLGQNFLGGPSEPFKIVKEERKKFDHAVSTIYQSLTRSRNLEGKKGGAHVLTPLLPHQEIALSFMLQREFGPILPEYSLWKYECNIKTAIYRHRLTNDESIKAPSELGGGILADDMGMGKTLSTLSLITTTLEEAHGWSRDPAGISRKCRSKATLVIVPSTLIMNSWSKEIESRLDKSLRIFKYYGKGRDLDIRKYLDRDIVLTTYHTIAASMSRSNSIIFQIEWFRVVLDEAHMIRRRETTLFQAASQLSARFRWCLTGTPIQNHLEDIGSLFAFLRISQLENKAVFHNQIVVPFAGGDIDSASRKFALLLDCICLRRSQELLHLPDITETCQYITLSDEERRQYDETLTVMAKLIREKANRQPDRHDPFGIFQAQLQLRLLCNHGSFQKPFTERNPRDRKAEREDFLYSLGKNAESICAICGIPIPVFDLIGALDGDNHPCGHKLCQECILQHRSDSPPAGVLTASCALCNLPIEKGYETLTQTQTQPQKASSHQAKTTREGYFKTSGYSSKIEALMKDLQHKSSDFKSIVFSCWTTSLDLVSLHLRRKGIPYQRIDGDQVLPQRQSNMDRFVADDSIPILLMSTGVGAFGLNLTAANHIYILEPQWNPSVETQAIGRVFRLGQNKAVSVTRYLVRGTVEVKMQSQQIRKLELSNIGFHTPQSLPT